MAAKFEPRPERRIASRTSLDPRGESRRRRVVHDLPAALHDVADEIELLANPGKVPCDRVDLLFAGDDDHPYSHVEDAQHLVARDVSMLPEKSEDRQYRP